MPALIPRLITRYYKALDLRKSGKSYNEISKYLHIAKSTASSWLKNVELSAETRKILLYKKDSALPHAYLVLANTRKELDNDKSMNVISNFMRKVSGQILLKFQLINFKRHILNLTRVSEQKADTVAA